MFTITPELVERIIITLAILSGSVWKLIDIFKPLFAKILNDDTRGMIKSICAGFVGWGMAWAFGVQTLNALGYVLHPALDAILAGLVISGGAGIFNVLYDILKVWKEYTAARVVVPITPTLGTLTYTAPPTIEPLPPIGNIK